MIEASLRCRESPHGTLLDRWRSEAFFLGDGSRRVVVAIRVLWSLSHDDPTTRRASWSSTDLGPVRLGQK